MEKIFIGSDIHGSAYACRQMLEAYKRENTKRMILLGDLLYHGPRNDLPREYAPKEVIDLLNQHRQEISAVRGNCEAEVDQMVLTFPVLADYMLLVGGTHTLFVTHGHLWNEGNMPPLAEGDILLHGHTHVYCAKKVESHWVLNPGSVAIPKDGNPPTYATLEEGVFSIRRMDGEIVTEAKLW